MKKLLNRLNIKQKIFVAILIPMVTIIITTISTIVVKKESIDNLDYFHKYYVYYKKINNIIHNIELERQIAFFYIGSSGTKYQNKLAEKREEIDTQFSNLSKFIRGNTEVFDTKLIKLVDDNIDQLELFRFNVDSLNVFLDIEKNFYTDLIYNLLYSASNIPAMTDNRYLSNQTLAYKHMIEAKEYLSLKAGLLNYVLASKVLTVSDINKLEFFDAFYKNNIMMFKYFVSQDIKSEFLKKKISQYGSSSKLQNLLKKQSLQSSIQLYKARDNERLIVDISKIDLTQVPMDITRKTNALKSIEDKLAQNILYTIKSERDKFYKDLQLFVVTILIITFLVFGIGFSISNNIIVKILKLEKGLVSFLKYVKREEKKFRPIKIHGNDEIDHMSSIVNESIRETAIFVQEEVKHEKRLYSQIMEAEKMAQMGEMIGNIAHQWRQPLSMISTVATGIKVSKEYGMEVKDTDLIKNMEVIDNYAQYLSETIDTFRDFIKEKKEIKIQTLQENIKSAVDIIGVVLKDVNIKLIDTVDYNIPFEVKIVSGELPQVIINLINNAKDVILEKDIDGGWVKINMYKKENTAIITIEDNGGGIPEEIIPKIFDPYFTTKHQSQGTGLGLHMSYRIVNESIQGKIYVANTQVGAKFFLEVPIYK